MGIPLNQFKNKKIVVMGLGLIGGGTEVVKFFVKHGADVLATDLRDRDALKKSLAEIKELPVKLVLGKHRKEDFSQADLIIKNPAVPSESPYLRIAREHNIPIKTDIGIFFDLCKGEIIGVTGTKGKSTVATIIYKLFKAKYPKTILAGNIGVSPLSYLEKITKDTIVVLELSSFQLEELSDCRKNPKIAVITNILPDHLNRYKSMKDYITAKKNIFLWQKKTDILILNYDNQDTRQMAREAKGRIYFYSAEKPAKNKDKFCFIEHDQIYFDNEKLPICGINDLRFCNTNIKNILAAITVAKLRGVPSKSIKATLKKFWGLAGRQEIIAKINGVTYINDTTATMPDATISAIEKFQGRGNVILIAGGVDKGLSYKKLAKHIAAKVNLLVLFPGTASEKLINELKILKWRKIKTARSMKEAVKSAAAAARSGDIVLFSPAAASFNMFQNEFDRGEQFNKAVKLLRHN